MFFARYVYICTYDLNVHAGVHNTCTCSVHFYRTSTHALYVKNKELEIGPFVMYIYSYTPFVHTHTHVLFTSHHTYMNNKN